MDTNTLHRGRQPWVCRSWGQRWPNVFDAVLRAPRAADVVVAGAVGIAAGDIAGR